MASVVAVSCHPDDVESGCFGTLALYKKRKATVTVLLLTGGERGGDKEVRLKAAKLACSVIGANIVFAGLSDGKVNDNIETVSWIEMEINKVKANVLFVPCPSDRHEDHRNGGNAGISAGRNVENLLLYETPTTVDFKPQVYVDIKETLSDKMKALSMHKLQNGELSAEAVRCLARYRACQMRLLGWEIETFQVIKWKLTPN